MAGSATITGKQPYVLGIGHPHIPASQEGAPLTNQDAAIFTPPTDDYEGIMSAINAAVAAGGGVVQLKPVTYDIGGNTLPLTAGVEIRGAGFQVNTGNAAIGGTVVQGDGSAPVFGHNFVDGDTPFSSIEEIRAQVCYRPAISNLAIKDGTYGIKAGALYKGGVYWGLFKELHIENCSEWDLWLENFQFCNLESIYTKQDSNGAGHQWYGSSSGLIFNHGNSTIHESFAEGGGTRTRGIVAMARGTSTSLNDVHFRKIQRNGLGAKVSAAATMTNGVADITVPDASVFPVDLPVTVSASANGFTQHQTYFVIASAGTTIQLSDFMGGAAKVPSGSTAVNIETYGWSCIEAVGYGPTSGNVIQPCSFTAVDVEGTGTNMFLAQNASLNLDISTAFYQQGTFLASTLAARSCFGTFRSSGVICTDFDGVSATGFLSSGYQKYTTAANVNSAPQGLVRTSGGEAGLHLGNNNSSVNVALKAVNSSGQSWLYPAHPIGQRIATSTATSLTMNGANAGALTYVGTANATWTLPTLSGASGGATNTYLGTTFELCNGSTTGGVTLTINAAASQGWNRTADTSLVLAVGQSITLRAETNGGTDWFWKIVGASPGVTL